MAKSEQYSSHPFPYFDTPVTRDLTVIAHQIAAKYKVAAPHEHRSSLHIWQEFLRNATLIAEKGKRVGEYHPKLEEINKIIDGIYPSVEADIQNYAVPDNKIHPDAKQKILANAINKWYLAPDVAQWMFDKVVAAHAIQIATDKVKVLGPKKEPVTGQRADCQPGAVKLTWTLPAGCRETEIRRTATDASAPPFRPHRLKQSECEFLDRSASPGVSYTYEIGPVIEDSSPGPFVSLPDVRPYGVVENFKVTVQGTSGAKLTWKNPERVRSNLVLRSPQPIPRVTNPSGLLQNLPSGITVFDPPAGAEYVDASLKRGATYFYLVVAKHPTGVCSVSHCETISLSELPPAPSTVIAEAFYGSNSVKWEKVKAPGEVSYQVTRSESPDLHDPAANPVTWKTKSNLIQDPPQSARPGKASRPAPEPGCNYWYSVVTEISGRFSDPPTFSNRVLAKAEVSDFKGRAENERIVLTWTPPDRVSRMEIRREINAPPPVPKTPGQPSGKESLFLVDRSARSFTEENLQNGTTYIYRISCVYEELDGSEIVTHGELVELKPEAAPSLITGFRIGRQKTGQGVLVEWNPPDAGNRGCVVRSAKLPDESIGRVYPIDELERLGDEISLNGSTAAIDYHPDPDHPNYLVFSARNQSARYCGFCQYVEVRSLDVKVTGRSATLQWIWPDHCREVAVTTFHEDRADHWVELHQRTVVRRGDQVAGHHAALLDQDGRYRFLIVTTADATGRQLPGPGVAREVEVGSLPLVTWNFEKPAAWSRLLSRKPPILAVTADSSLRSVSSLVLVGKEAETPASPSDGVCLAEVTVANSPDLQWRQPIRSVREAFGTSAVGEVWCRLFSNPEGAAVITPPPFDQRKLEG